MIRSRVGTVVYSLPASLSLASRMASLALPTAFCTRPSALSALPSASVLASPVALPQVSLTAPFACLAAPFTRSLSISISLRRQRSGTIGGVLFGRLGDPMAGGLEVLAGAGCGVASAQ